MRNGDTSILAVEADAPSMPLNIRNDTLHGDTVMSDQNPVVIGLTPTSPQVRPALQREGDRWGADPSVTSTSSVQAMYLVSLNNCDKRIFRDWKNMLTKPHRGIAREV